MKKPISRIIAIFPLRLKVILVVSLIGMLSQTAARGEAVMAETDTLTAPDVFKSLPVSVLDLLRPSERLDMLDYAAVDSMRPTRNTLGELSVLTFVSRQALDVKLTNVSSLAIRILQTKKKGDVAMTIYTVGRSEGSEDSRICFYNADMQQLPLKNFISLPTIDNFLIDNKDWKNILGNASRKGVLSKIPFITVAYSMTPGSDLLTARLTIGKYMPKENYESVEPYLKEELRYRWDGTAFRPVP